MCTWPRFAHQKLTLAMHDRYLLRNSSKPYDQQHTTTEQAVKVHQRLGVRSLEGYVSARIRDHHDFLL